MITQLATVDYGLCLSSEQLQRQNRAKGFMFGSPESCEQPSLRVSMCVHRRPRSRAQTHSNPDVDSMVNKFKETSRGSTLRNSVLNARGPMTAAKPGMRECPSMVGGSGARDLDTGVGCGPVMSSARL